MALTIKRNGYGQVEPNHLSAQRTGQIYAQLPADNSIEILENGMFVKYDMANNKVAFTGAGEWMLVFNEIKLYDERKQGYKDYAMLKTDCLNGEMVPRVFKTNIGDIMTTNVVKEEEIKKGDSLVVGEDGILAKYVPIAEETKPESGMAWEVVAETTLPDGDPAVKVMRIQ